MLGALAFCRPGKSVPEFKFRHGPAPLVKNCGRDVKHYYSAWAQFVKLAKEWRGELVLLRPRNVALSVNAAEKIARLTSPFAPGAGGASFDELVAGAEPPAGVTRDGDGRLFTSDHHSLEGADAVVATGPDSARFDVRTMELARFLNVGGLAGSYAIALR